MIYENLNEFKKKLKINKRIIGLDLGRNNIGIALSDRDKNIATPKLILKRKSTVLDIEFLKKYLFENDVCAIVSGIPLNSNEEYNRNNNYILSFINKLNNVIDMPIFLNNEFLTSFDAENILIENIGFNKTKSVVDKVAASIILQEVLDKLKIIEQH